jgi:hypothetical protein
MAIKRRAMNEEKACDNCGDETEDFLTNYADSPDEEALWLCDICAKEDDY